jgi:hypothetical protein
VLIFCQPLRVFDLLIEIAHLTGLGLYSNDENASMNTTGKPGLLPMHISDA